MRRLCWQQWSAPLTVMLPGNHKVSVGCCLPTVDHLLTRRGAMYLAAVVARDSLWQRWPLGNWWNVETIEIPV